MTASAAHSTLPLLSAAEERHSSAATALIREQLAAAGGWLSFAQFMELALYAPGLGYYSAGSVKLGASGDFVTAPEVSDLFSRCVARQCADVLAETGGEILEVGAGTGRMAVTLLQALAGYGILPDRYAILEVSADLADRQRARVQQLPPALRDRVVWLERLPQTPVHGVIVANEVLDALPCQRFVVRGGRAYELGVGLRLCVGRDDGVGDAWLAGGHNSGVVSSRPDTEPGDTVFLVEPGAGHAARFAKEAPARSVATVAAELTPQKVTADSLVWSEAPDEFAAATAMLHELPEPLPDGYVSELCLRVEPWLTSVGQCLGHGALLLFDYGLPRAHYYHPQRTDGTLRCYFKQRAHDNPFVNISVQDITAWVDFTRVGEAALAAGLDVAGFATQAAFLLGTGIEAMAAEPTDTTTRARLASEARRLLLPGEMGESFKVMAVCRNLQQPLRGFAYQDLRTSL
jgi:SAM-dependent MidA family methyltransferase